ncbi:MAG: hypothetical protein AVDCRST_MAG19-1163 [uncultured Thermomicrobiales bacterium]|uniref:Uncharacterized protein n=1 Tax=uncultured Thermomicrobiales bacterium TaxID=1645740 RepID=A0A6J4UN09_9BACT|nr:MAG: hypothetical protein AVDCRST_MAG19-1163 [uncultured Thermomicrobiales bacterium]
MPSTIRAVGWPSRTARRDRGVAPYGSAGHPRSALRLPTISPARETRLRRCPPR